MEWTHIYIYIIQTFKNTHIYRLEIRLIIFVTRKEREKKTESKRFIECLITKNLPKQINQIIYVVL